MSPARHAAEQIAAYCVSAIAGGTMFYRWRRMDLEDQQRVWRLYGWYSALMFCGSCFGIVAWASRIMFLVNRFEWTKNFQNLSVRYSLRALDLSWTAAFVVAYAFEFLFLSSAQLMVLDRMSDAVPQQLGDVMRARLVVGGRIVMAVVVLGNAAGLSANVAAAVYFQKSSHDYNAASACYFSNNTKVGLEHVASGISFFQLGLFVLSMQRLFEVAVLLLIVVAFAAVGIMCARRLSSALDVLDQSGLELAAGMRRGQQQVVDAAVALGKEMRQEIIVTTSFVFACFVLRSAASTFLALAFQLQNLAMKCPGVLSDCDAGCYNMFAHMNQWQIYTPVSTTALAPPSPPHTLSQEFQPTVVLVSSPIALLVALRGITNKRTRQLMSSSVQRTPKSLLNSVQMRTLRSEGSSDSSDLSPGRSRSSWLGWVRNSVSSGFSSGRSKSGREPV
jgi:hypothetical protein